jgi:hypothetical protein
MNKAQNDARDKCRRLLTTALHDLNRGDRTDALDAIRMAQRELRESMPAAMVNFLPELLRVELEQDAPGAVRVAFGEPLTPTHLRVIEYALKQMVWKRK